MGCLGLELRSWCLSFGSWSVTDGSVHAGGAPARYPPRGGLAEAVKARLWSGHDPAGAVAHCSDWAIEMNPAISEINAIHACGLKFKFHRHHHKPSAKSLSLLLNNPVGPRATRGFSLFLADLGFHCPARFSPDSRPFSLSLLCSFRTCGVGSPEDQPYAAQRVTVKRRHAVLLSIGRAVWR